MTDFAADDLTVTGATTGTLTAGTGNTWTLLVTPSADYNITVRAAAATDAAGNGNAAVSANGSYDTSGPQVSSIERHTPATSPTNADTLTWRVTFSEDVQNVDPADFAISGTTATLAVAAVTNAPRAYDVTASGPALADLDATVTLSFATGQDITDPAGNALNTSVSGTNDNTYVLDNTAPVLTISGVPASANGAFTATFTFSEAVTDFAADDLTVTGATTGTLTAGTGNTWTLLVTPSADYNITVRAAAATDAAGNGNAAVSANGSYDTSGPQVSSIERHTPATSPTNADTLTWRVTFSEDVQNVDPADFAISGTTATLAVAAVTNAPRAYDVTASGPALADLDATVTLSFATGQDITDPAGNALNTSVSGTNDNTYVLDNTAPVLTISGVPASANGAFTATFTFSEAVTDFAADDLTVTGATTGTLTAGTGNTWTLLVTPSADYNITVRAAAATDAAGNGNAAVSANGSYDTSGPQVSSIERHTPATSPTNADTLTWRVTFSEDVQNVDPADFAISGTTATLAVAAVTNAPRAYDVTASGPALADLDATVTLSFATGQDITDPAGNALNTSVSGTNDNTYVLDNTAPVLTISGVPASANGAFTATFTFSEAVTDFAADDLTVTGATTGTLTAGTGNTWTLLVTPSADYNITVRAAAATDAAGNGNAAVSANGSYDTSGPQVSSIERHTPATSPTNADTLTWRVTFSEDVQNVDPADFAISGTTATLAVAAVTNAPRAYDVTASGPALADLDATVTLSFATGQDITDPAGNALNTSVSGTNDNTYVLDNTAPVLTISGVPASANGAFTATFTFSEAVTDFAADDLTVTGATTGTLTAGTGNTWTLLVTPSADYNITVRAAAATDAAGNGNAAVSANGSYDTSGPQVSSIERHTPATSPTNADTLTWRVTFSEDVQNVDPADFAISGTTATLAVAAVTNAPRAYDVTASGPALADLDATVTLSFATGQDITDPAGNALNTSVSGTNDNTYVLDNTAPVLTISGVPASANGAFTATFTFSEAVTDFAADDLTVTGATTGTLTAGTGNTWTLLVTPSADYNITVRAAAATDAAGNGNAAVSANGSYDTSGPQVSSIERHTPATSPTNADTLTWRVTFSEDVQNVDPADFAISGTTATLAVAAVTNAPRAYDVTASGPALADLDATVTLSFATGQDITDPAGNALNTSVSGTNDNTYVLDNTAPVLTISGVPASANGAFTATFTFSEAVTDFAADDLTVTGATTGTLTAGTGNTWTLLVTPSADYNITVRAAAATDAAGNGNAAVSANGSYDTSGPQVSSIERHTPATSPTNADTLTWRVTFGEDVQNVDAADFTISGTTATLERHHYRGRRQEHL